MRFPFAISLFLIAQGSSAAEALLPFSLEHFTPELNKTVRIEIAKSKTGRFKLSYTFAKEPAAKTIDSTFSGTIIWKLLKILQPEKAPAISAWHSDEDCMVLERWKLQAGNSKDLICKDSQHIKALRDFERSAQLLLEH